MQIHSPVADPGNVPGSAVSLRNIVKRYGSVVATNRISLEVVPGEFLSLLGPSGSGKTTLLMLIAGFEVQDEGELFIGGREITGLPPNKRNLGMVFQKYALFPHMTVAQNIAFPLRMRKMPKAERDERIAQALAMVKLAGYQDRMPAQLSGGQQQRVALARAIVFGPQILLMDEPLGALDRKLRKHMQVELKELQSRIGATVIYVTHDQEEALAMSDRVAIVNKGHFEQLGHPRTLYDRPASAFVADFVGEVNFLKGTVVAVEGRQCKVGLAGSTFVGTIAESSGTLSPSDQVQIGIRPERMRLQTGLQSGLQSGEAAAPNAISGSVAHSVFNGGSVAVHVDVGGGAMMRVVVGPNAPVAWLESGTAVTIGADPDEVFIFPFDGEI